jgi:hypothetical protein
VSKLIRTLFGRLDIRFLLIALLKKKPPEALAVAKIQTLTGNPIDLIGYPLSITAGPILPLQGMRSFN